MSSDEITQIKIGNNRTGIIGLKLALMEVAEAFAVQSDEEIRTELLKRLVERNYIPESSKEEYGNAFLREFKKLTVCKRLFFHYNGMAMQNYKKFLEHGKTTVKKYLYVLRSLMAGIYVLEKGKIQPNIIELNKHFKFDVIKELVKLKKKEKIKMPKNSALNNKAQKLIADLFTRLKECREKSKLPEEPKTKRLNEFLIKIRKENL